MRPLVFDFDCVFVFVLVLVYVPLCTPASALIPVSISIAGRVERAEGCGRLLQRKRPPTPPSGAAADVLNLRG